MIFRLRMEGAHDSADTLQQEFAAMASHFGFVGFLEGVTGRELLSGETVFESTHGQLVDVAGAAYDFAWKGRHTVVLKPLENVDYRPLFSHPQPDYRVFGVPETVEADHDWSLFKTARDWPVDQLEERRDMIVLGRMRPVHWPGPEDLEAVSSPLREDTVERFQITVVRQPHVERELIGGWVALKVGVVETTEGAHGFATGERFACTTTVPPEECDAEADRLLSTAQAYVTGILQGQTGARYFGATLETFEREKGHASG